MWGHFIHQKQFKTFTWGLFIVFDVLVNTISVKTSIFNNEKRLSIIIQIQKLTELSPKFIILAVSIDFFTWSLKDQFRLLIYDVCSLVHAFISLMAYSRLRL
jgi:hypothetical protein